ncbi:hypothetical protein AAHC03_016519 [Spirometra sp. Aus1]
MLSTLTSWTPLFLHASRISFRVENFYTPSILLLCRLLTGCKISDEASAIECMDMLHNYGIPTVIFSSTELHNADERGRLLTGYVSHRADLAAERRSSQPLDVSGTFSIFLYSFAISL